MRIVTPDEKNGIYLGRQGENLATQVQFDVNVAGWVETYGVGTWQLLNRRPSDPAGYPVEISVEDNIIKWDLTATDLKYAGCGTCELVYYVDEVIAKSIIYGTQILPAIDGTGEIPEPWESWIDEVEEARDEAVEAAGEAAQSERDAADSAGAASGSAEAASGSAASAEADALKAEGFAVGEQNGQPVKSGSPYHENNAKYYKEQAAALAEEIEHSIDDIEALIPNQASPENQLADKNFVNSSISTNTANYISNNGQPFTSVEQLEAYSGPVSNNDYAFVTGTDSAGNTFYDRYKATVSEGVVSWAFEYRLNNSSFTAAQWAAIESGITASQVANYNAHLANQDNPHSVTKEQIGLGNVDNTPDAQKPVSQAQAAALALKADKVVDAVAGDIAALDANGNLTDSGISPSDLELVKEVSNDPAHSSFDIAIQDGQPAPVLGAVLKGKTAAVNQLVVNGDFASTSGWTNISSGNISASNNTLIVSWTPSFSNNGIGRAIPLAVVGHTFLLSCQIKNTSDTSRSFAIGQPYSTSFMVSKTIAGGATEQLEGIATLTSAISSATGMMYSIFSRSTGSFTVSIEAKNFMLIDLTLCGFTSEETTDVATLKATWLNKYGVPLPSYIPYNAGSIVSNDATYQLTGKNLAYSTLAGYNINSSGKIVSSASFDVHIAYLKAGRTYAVTTGEEGLLYALFDSEPQVGDTAPDGRVITSEPTVTPTKDCYIAFRSPSGYATAQIEKGTTATTYEPYHDGGSIQGDDLNGFEGTEVYDTQSLTERQRKCIKVDMGSLNWQYASNRGGYMWVELPLKKKNTPMICARYKYIGVRPDPTYDEDKVIALESTATDYIDVHDTAYTDPAAFKTAMSGTYLVYELATPTSETVTGASLETKEGYNLLRPVSGDLQSGEVSMTYVKSSYLAKLIAWIRSIL